MYLTGYRIIVVNVQVGNQYIRTLLEELFRKPRCISDGQETGVAGVKGQQ